MNQIVSISETANSMKLRVKAEQQMEGWLKEAQEELQLKYKHERLTIDRVSVDQRYEGDYLVTCTVLLSGNSGISLGATESYTSMRIYNTEYFRFTITTNDQARETITHKLRSTIITKASEAIEQFFIDNNTVDNIAKLDIIFGNFKNYMKKRAIGKVKKLNE